MRPFCALEHHRRVRGSDGVAVSRAREFLAECKAVVAGVFVMPMRRTLDQGFAAGLERLPDDVLRDIGMERERR
jgi:hypothetical protein